MSRFKLPQMGIVIVVCALVGALAGIAGSAAAPSKRAGAGKSSAKMFRFGMRHEGLRGLGHAAPGGPAVHAEAVVPNRAGTGFITVTSDAGKVKSVSGNDVTIDESVGTLHYRDVTVTIPSGATVIRDHARATVGELKAGDFVRVVTSSEFTFVMAEDAAFRRSERRRFNGQGGWEHHGPPPGMPAPQGQGGTY